ncbi:MAG: APC family permease [Acidobacteria bacterium]|nr:APC family permease [Acidobacteriota bacterium]
MDVRHEELTELPATAICGNDITSSCLYVSALAILAAGKYAALSLLIVAGVLYLFRSIYAEVVGALPLNGGAYNALLNTTSKRIASLAACLTLLSYMATAVISAGEAVHYVHGLFHGLPVREATIVLLAIFMVLTIIGIGESSKVAVAIFLTHMVTLTLLLVAGGIFLFQNGFGILLENLAAPTEMSPAKALFFGFAAALLGISGFESSANFVEEQANGVFPKTLRNMWLAVSFFNPMMAILALSLVRIPEVAEHQVDLLAHMGGLSGGKWLAVLVSVDAALVLSGAVLTSFVGVTGLARRMTLDRVLPQFLLKTNRRGTTHRIIVGFFVLSVSVLLITRGELEALAGVYTLSFLAVMALFGVGNILLKVRRDRLPRPVRASWAAVLLAILAVTLGLAGTAIRNPDYAGVFLAYFIPAVIIVAIMLGRIGLLKAVIFFVRSISEAVSGWSSSISQKLREKVEEISAQEMVFFTRGDNVSTLNRAMLYVRRNEHTKRLKVAIVKNEKNPVPERLEKDLAFLDEVYPDLQVEYVELEGDFGPPLIDRLSQEWKIPKNFMFIGSPGDRFPYRLEHLGGVRLII